MPRPDPYAVLGVHPSASEDEIHNAYKALARKWHPDRHQGNPQAEDKFRTISEAYNRIKEGDTGSDMSFKGFKKDRAGAATFGSNVNNVVSNLFGGAAKKSAPQAPAQQQPSAPPRRASSRSQTPLEPNSVGVPFEAAILGGDHTLEVRRNASPIIEKLRVKLPSGVEQGMRLEVERDVVSAHVMPHAYFKRDGDDVVVNVPLTLAEIVMGARVQVPTLTGRVEIRFPPGTKPGKRLRLKGKGVPNRGDQYCVVALAVPDVNQPGVADAVQSLNRVEGTSPRPWDAPGSNSKAGSA